MGLPRPPGSPITLPAKGCSHTVLAATAPCLFRVQQGC
jgi:hypothetical protein